MRVSKTREGPITAVFRIRGQAPEAIILPCQDWEQAVRKAHRMLPCFEQRNPWLFLDSRNQKLYVLLDPDTELLTAHSSMQARPKTRTVSKKGTRL